MIRRIRRHIKPARQWLNTGHAKLIRMPVLGAVAEWIGAGQRQRISGMAAESAYYIILAFFPFFIFLISLLGLIGQRSDMTSWLLSELQGIIPGPLLLTIESFLIETVESSNLTLASFSMLGVVWASSSGFSVLLRGLDRAYDLEHTYSFITLRLLGLLLTLILGLVILMTLLLIAFGGLVLEQLLIHTSLTIASAELLQWLRFLASFVLLFLVFIFLYAATATRGHRLRKAWPGALFAAAAWIVLSAGFSWYISNFDRYARLYGSIAGLILLLVWIYLCCTMLLYGGVLNAVIEKRRLRRAGRRQASPQS